MRHRIGDGWEGRPHHTEESDTAGRDTASVIRVWPAGQFCRGLCCSLTPAASCSPRGEQATLHYVTPVNTTWQLMCTGHHRSSETGDWSRWNRIGSHMTENYLRAIFWHNPGKCIWIGPIFVRCCFESLNKKFVQPVTFFLFWIFICKIRRAQ